MDILVPGAMCQSQEPSHWVVRVQGSRAEDRALGQLTQVQMDGEKTSNGLNPSGGGYTKHPSDPQSGMLLHGAQVLEDALHPSALPEPQTEPICGNRQHTSPVEQALLEGEKPPQ